MYVVATAILEAIYKMSVLYCFKILTVALYLYDIWLYLYLLWRRGSGVSTEWHKSIETPKNNQFIKCCLYWTFWNVLQYQKLEILVINGYSKRHFNEATRSFFLTIPLPTQHAVHRVSIYHASYLLLSVFKISIYTLSSIDRLNNRSFNV